jgi:peptidoglycan/LPS O-acetylase OafA/YrhL
LFFATGALLWRHRDRLPRVGRHWPVHLTLGLVSLGIAWSLTPPADWMNPDATAVMVWCRIGASVLAAIGHWQLVWAVVGAFNRFAAGTAPRLRYVADASYWVYLVHLPVVIWVAAALLTWDVSRFVKFPLVLGASLGLPLLTYHLFVRMTFVGTFLNGAKVPNSRPPADPYTVITYVKSPKAP